MKPCTMPDGSCAECLGGWLCAYHQEETARVWNNRQAELRKAAINSRLAAIERIMASRELESDEGGTAESKAAAMYDAGVR